jgi:riboflavin kinase/FMN adenylyltransferase
MRVFRDLLNQKIDQSGAAVTIGNFDGLHLGHKALIDTTLKAAKQRQLISTLLSFEPLPKQYFDPESQPFRLQSTTGKLRQLREWGIQQVCLLRFNRALASLSAEDFIQQILLKGLNTRQLFVGEDFRFGKDRGGDIDMLARAAKENGFETHFMQAVCVQGERVSSTRLREALATGNMQLAEVLLGRSYSISGRVLKGQQLGRKLGYPTANISMQHRPCPVAGVFAIEVELPGYDRPLPGVASIGKRPTVGGRKLLLEAHLFDFNADLYGQRIKVKLIEHLRGEAHFSSLDELTEKMQQDELLARAVLARRME